MISASTSGVSSSAGLGSSAAADASRAHLLRDAGQQAVDEPSGVVGREARGQLDGLRQDDPCRDVGAGDQLSGAHPQRGAVERRHAGESPALGEAPQERIDLRTVLIDGQHQGGGEVVGVDRERGQDLSARRALRLSLVEQAEGPLPCRPPLGGEGHLLQARVM
jgi:hypothetical protein